MSFDYTDLAAVADELLAEFGADATITRVTPGEYDPATSSVGAGTTTTITGRAVESTAERSYVDGSLIEAGRMVYLVAPTAAIAPLAGDVFTWGGIGRSVVKAKPLAPNGIVLLHEIQVAL